MIRAYSVTVTSIVDCHSAFATFSCTHWKDCSLVKTLLDLFPVTIVFHRKEIFFRKQFLKKKKILCLFASFDNHKPFSDKRNDEEYNYDN